MTSFIRCLRALSFRVLTCTLIAGILFPVQFAYAAVRGTCVTESEISSFKTEVLAKGDALIAEGDAASGNLTKSQGGQCATKLSAAVKQCETGTAGTAQELAVVPQQQEQLSGGNAEGVVNLGTTGQTANAGAQSGYSGCVGTASAAANICKQIPDSQMKQKANQLVADTKDTCSSFLDGAGKKAAADQSKAAAKSMQGGGSNWLDGIKKALPWIIGAGLLGAGVAALMSMNKKSDSSKSKKEDDNGDEASSLSQYSNSSTTNSSGSSISVEVIVDNTIKVPASEIIPPGSDDQNDLGVSDGEEVLVAQGELVDDTGLQDISSASSASSDEVIQDAPIGDSNLANTRGVAGGTNAGGGGQGSSGAKSNLVGGSTGGGIGGGEGGASSTSSTDGLQGQMMMGLPNRGRGRSSRSTRSNIIKPSTRSSSSTSSAVSSLAVRRSKPMVDPAQQRLLMRSNLQQRGLIGRPAQ